MGKLTKLAATVPFAHLLGIRAESDDEDQKKDDEKAKSKAKAEDDEQREDESDEDYKKRKAEGDDPEKKDDDAKGSKAAKAESDDEESDDKKKDDAKASAAGERARCKAIIAYGVQSGMVRTAGTFAFDTDMSADAAIAALAASKADARSEDGLAGRMAGVVIPSIGDGGPAANGPDLSTPAGRAKAQADSILAAASKARGEKAKQE